VPKHWWRDTITVWLALLVLASEVAPLYVLVELIASETGDCPRS